MPLNNQTLKKEVDGHEVVFSFGEQNTEELNPNFLGPNESYHDQPLQNVITKLVCGWVPVYVLTWIIPEVADANDLSLGVFKSKEDAMIFAEQFVPEYRWMMVKYFDGEQEKIDQQYKEKFYFSIHKCGYYEGGLELWNKNK